LDNDVLSDNETIEGAASTIFKDLKKVLEEHSKDELVLNTKLSRKLILVA